MGRPDLVTLGESFEDLIFLDLARIPGPGEEVKTQRFQRSIGGGAVITAVAAARLGSVCRVYSGLPLAAERRLEDEGVAFTNLRRRHEPHAVSAALSTRANRSFATFDGVNDLVEGRLLNRIGKVRARHVHLALQPRNCRPWVTAVLACGSRGITCSWDFGWNPALLRDPQFEALVAALDLLFLNEQEALLYSGRRTVPTALEAWRGVPAQVVVKFGRRGSCIVTRAGALRVAASREAAVDTTGAGDAFNGGFLVGRLRGYSPVESLRLGNFVGGRSTRAAGGLDGLPTAGQARRVLSGRLR